MPDRVARASIPTIGLFEVDAEHFDILSNTLKTEGFAVELVDPRRYGESQPLVYYSALILDVTGIPVGLRKYFAKLLSKAECPPILATAPADMAEAGMRDAFALGCFDFIRQPFEVFDIRARLNVALRRALRDDGTRHRIEDLELRLQQQQRNMTEARRLQLEFSAPSYDRMNNLEIAHLLRPSQALGGDLANVIEIDPRYTIFYMIDVAGHGIASTLYAISVASWLQVDVRRNLLDELGRPRDPSLVVSDLNNAFPLDETGLRYFTMTYGVIDFEEGEISYTRAGHTELIVWRDGDPVVLSDGDTPVGVSPSATFTDLQVAFPPNAVALLFSDGVVDQPNHVGERYGMQRLLEDLGNADTHNVTKLLRHIHNRGSMWRAGEPVLDDQSVLILRRLPETETEHTASNLRVHTQTLLRSRVPATMESASAVSALVGAIIQDARGRAVAAELRLAMMEALSNIIRHGYQGVYDGNQVIEVALIDDRERVGVTLLDYGPEFDPTKAAARTEVCDLSLAEETPHLGLSLVSRSVDEMFYERRGDKNQLLLSKLINTGPNWSRGARFEEQ
jgi:sigma-B regulation protein RsbU (phosphoserine phosphatase)